MMTVRLRTLCGCTRIVEANGYYAEYIRVALMPPVSISFYVNDNVPEMIPMKYRMFQYYGTVDDLIEYREVWHDENE